MIDYEIHLKEAINRIENMQKEYIDNIRKMMLCGTYFIDLLIKEYERNLNAYIQNIARWQPTINKKE